MHLCSIFIICLLFITPISSRALYYDQLNEYDNFKPSSIEDEGKRIKSKCFACDLNRLFLDLQNLQPKVSKLTDDDLSYDSYEERQFHQRALFSTTHAMTTHTRQALIDLLQKAFDQGWRPPLKHYIPATRFGRHRR